MTHSPFGGTASPTTEQDTPQGRPAEFGSTSVSGQSAPSDPDGGAVDGTPRRGERGSGERRPAGRVARNRGPRRARLQLRHISPLTVLKFSCVLAVALFFVWLIVIGVLYGILDAAGAIEHVNTLVVQLGGGSTKPPVTAGIVFGGAAIVGVVNIVLFVALATVGAVIYNLCADLVGGVEITLSER